MNFTYPSLWYTDDVQNPLTSILKINEKENKEMPKKNLVQRLYEERDELETKITKLKEFVSSEAFEYLSLEDRDLLRAQENAMVTYHSILNIRIKHIKKEY
jgi:hypothetical protein